MLGHIERKTRKNMGVWGEGKGRQCKARRDDVMELVTHPCDALCDFAMWHCDIVYHIVQTLPCNCVSGRKNGQTVKHSLIPAKIKGKGFL